jgi:protein phosphatase
MGGHADGEFASLTAVTTLLERAYAIKGAASRKGIDTAVQKYVAEANKKLCDRMRAHSVRMGTTLALVVVTNRAIHPYNLGDSRIYSLSEGQFTRVSEEHTLAWQKVRMGVITEEEAEHDKGRHMLTSHLGIFEEEMVVMAAVHEPIPLDRARRLLLCSDGLTDMVTSELIEKILKDAPSAEEAVSRLVREALKNGGRDNVTCVVLDTPSSSDGAAPKELDAPVSVLQEKPGFLDMVMDFVSRVFSAIQGNNKK